MQKLPELPVQKFQNQSGELYLGLPGLLWKPALTDSTRDHELTWPVSDSPLSTEWRLLYSGTSSLWQQPPGGSDSLRL